MVKVGIEMQSFSCVLSQRLVSVLFIAAVPTHIYIYIYIYMQRYQDSDRNTLTEQSTTLTGQS